MTQSIFSLMTYGLSAVLFLGMTTTANAGCYTNWKKVTGSVDYCHGCSGDKACHYRKNKCDLDISYQYIM